MRFNLSNVASWRFREYNIRFILVFNSMRVIAAILGFDYGIHQCVTRFDTGIQAAEIMNLKSILINICQRPSRNKFIDKLDPKPSIGSIIPVPTAHTLDVEQPMKEKFPKRFNPYNNFMCASFHTATHFLVGSYIHKQQSAWLITGNTTIYLCILLDHSQPLFTNIYHSNSYVGLRPLPIPNLYWLSIYV